MVRGMVTIDASRCKGCQLCVESCPQSILALSQQYNSSGYLTVSLVEDGGRCTGCGLCALVCPDLVFTVYREVTHPRRVRAAAAPTPPTPRQRPPMDRGAHDG